MIFCFFSPELIIYDDTFSVWGQFVTVQHKPAHKLLDTYFWFTKILVNQSIINT